ncbi:MAG TPA: acetate--CoA ligase, partial [Cellulomonas sp.]
MTRQATARVLGAPPTRTPPAAPSAPTSLRRRRTVVLDSSEPLATEPGGPGPDTPAPDDAPAPGLENLLTEDRRFPPDPAFKAQANAHAEIYPWAASDRLSFWAEQARSLLDWSTPFAEVLDWSGAPVARWFGDGRLNAAYNAVDRHVEAGNGDRVALHFEGEPGDTRTLTYADLQREVSRAANALEALGVGPGDRVALYMPLIPETVVAMLACARIGAPHSVVFGGFSAEALHSRIMDAEATVVITADGGYRRGAASALKPTVDEALGKGSDQVVRHVLVVRRTGQDVPWTEGRDVWWHDAVDGASDQHVPVAVEAEHPLFILYTSGTTGKPKGILHTSGGYLTQASYTHWAVFDLKPETDVFWCTADIGWVTGHSYIVYGPLSNGATSVMWEGAPDYPHQGIWWEVAERYKATILYAAPTAIRTFIKWGSDIPAKYYLSSLRLLGSVGEPINPKAWLWYHKVIGGERCPIVDTWWQTETGGIMITPLPGITATKPGSATQAFPGVEAQVVGESDGEPVEEGQGLLMLEKPWPSMLRTLYKEDDRFIETYFSKFGRDRY